ncbi:MAG: PD-(D/E)XK nuclease family protein, partial [Paracoccaceae bacterium]
IMIWGTLEARVQGADLIVLGGLNDGVWPEMPTPDPWLNRGMRVQAGLLVPERRVGLSAHDFQQAVAAKEVILSRPVRDAEAETVPSRWLNRLTNLMHGMSDEGREALGAMRARGQVWLDLAARLETPEPVSPAPRPSPRPPVAARPRALSVTAISRLIRDPYAIYAQYVLRLNRLDPLHQEPDAPLRGTIVHSILERFIRDTDLSTGPQAAREKLLQTTDAVLAREAPWPATRALWRARLERIADRFVEDEHHHRKIATALAFEQSGSLWLADLDFTLTAKADRIDRTPDGQFVVYDYKTGAVPSKGDIRNYEKQLLLEAVMVQDGAFHELGRGPVHAVAHIGLGADAKFRLMPLERGDTDRCRAELIELLGRYQRPDQGYTSRRAMDKAPFAGNYDHLARSGEWNDADSPQPEEVGE